MERDREDWTNEDERHPEGEPGSIPVQEEGLAVGLEGQDGFDTDLDPEIAAEVELQEETRETEEEHGPTEDAAEDLTDDH